MHCIFDGTPVLHVPSFCIVKYLWKKTCCTAQIFRIRPRLLHKHKLFHIDTFTVSAVQLFGFQWHIKSIEDFVWLEAENSCVWQPSVSDHIYWLLDGVTVSHFANVFIHMHTFLADAFIQSDLHCIQAIHFFMSVCSLGIEPTTFCAANAMLYHWATGIH